MKPAGLLLQRGFDWIGKRSRKLTTEAINTKSRKVLTRPQIKRQEGWKVILGAKASRQLWAYQLAAGTSEIGGLVYLREIPDLSPKIKSLEIHIEEFIPLAAGLAGLSVSPKLFGKGIHKALEKNLDPDLLRGVWHTHPGMGVFWSGTDEKGMASLLKTNSLATSEPWLLSVVASGTLIIGRLDRLIEGVQFQTPLTVDWGDSIGSAEFVAEAEKILETVEVPKGWGKMNEEWDLGPPWDPSWNPPSNQGNEPLYCFLSDCYLPRESVDFYNAKCIGCIHRQFCLPESDEYRSNSLPDPLSTLGEIQTRDCPYMHREGQDLYCKLYGCEMAEEDCLNCYRF